MRSKTKKEKRVNSHSVNQQLVSAKKYSIRLTGQYKCSAERCRKRGYNEGKLENVVDILAGGGQLPPKFLKHPLHGLFKGSQECHISDDLLLVWRRDVKKRKIILIALGTHCELFNKQRR